ncbi:MAG TPA: hypothetical protein VFJ60_02990 [Gaiella sp.]|nr:hypothetical protein [Gaiella sp.]
MPERMPEVAREESPAGDGTGLGTELVRGRRSETPFLLVGGTAVVIGVIIAVLAGALLLVWWLG